MEGQEIWEGSGRGGGEGNKGVWRGWEGGISPPNENPGYGPDPQLVRCSVLLHHAFIVIVLD